MTSKVRRRRLACVYALTHHHHQLHIDFLSAQCTLLRSLFSGAPPRDATRPAADADDADTFITILRTSFVVIIVVFYTVHTSAGQLFQRKGMQLGK